MTRRETGYVTESSSSPITAPGLRIESVGLTSAHVVRWRGDPAPASAWLGVDLAVSPGSSRGDTSRVIWLAPHEVLVLGLRGKPELAAGALLAVDQSDALIALRVSGTSARDLLAKGCTLDFESAVMAVNCAAQTCFVQVHALVDRTASNTYELYVDCSLRSYLFDWFTDAVVEFST
jgi:sarcosine oxidase, subunit gamma